MERFLFAVTLVCLLGACGSSHSSVDAGVVPDATPGDSGWTGPGRDVGTHQAELDASRLGRCEPDEEAACGCIDGFRRCDLCADRCPTGWGCNRYAQVCRARDADAIPDGTGGTTSYSDSCNFFVDDGSSGRSLGTYCMTGKVCAVGVDDTGLGTNVFGGSCFPVSFCKAAAVAGPPAPQVRCVYSDGTPVVNGPPPGDTCPVGDPREPFCGGACGEYLRCPDPKPRPRAIVGGPYDPTEPAPCLGLSETRNLGVCGYAPGRAIRGGDFGNGRAIARCADWYGEPCAILVTHPQLDEAHFEQGYLLLASVCRDYAARFRDSAECVGADWSPLP